MPYFEASEPGVHPLRLFASHHTPQILDDIYGIEVGNIGAPSCKLALTPNTALACSDTLSPID
jgi:hypothetical protein